MAFDSGSWFLEFVAVDKGSNTTRRRYQFAFSDTDGDVSVLRSVITSFLADFANVSDCKIRQYTLSQSFVDSSFTLPTADTAEVSQHAEISGQIANLPNKRATIDIPGPKNGIFAGASGELYNVVDVTDTDVIDYMTHFNESSDEFFLSDGEQLATAPNLAGKRTHTRSRNG